MDVQERGTHTKRIRREYHDSFRKLVKYTVKFLSSLMSYSLML
jgi:hypothetical protein